MNEDSEEAGGYYADGLPHRIYDGNQEAWGHYTDRLPHRMCTSANYNYYGSSHLQQFPQFEYASDTAFYQVPGPSASCITDTDNPRIKSKPDWEPSADASDNELEDCVEPSAAHALLV